MFKNLTKFTYVRDWKGAIGFYLAYLFLVVLLALFAGAAAHILGASDKFSLNVKIGGGIAIIFCLAIHLMLMKEKKLYNSFWDIILLLLTGLLAAFGGGILGLVIPSYVTTRPNKK